MASTVPKTLNGFDNEVHHVVIGIQQVFRLYAPLIIIVFGIFIRLPLTVLPLTYSATDTWRQADTASIAHNFMEGGKLLYPQIDWGGNGQGYVEAEFQLYPYIVSKLYLLFGEQVGLGRLVSLLFSVGTFAVFYRLGRRLVGSKAAVWGLLFLVLSPLSIRYSVTFMPEATMFFFYITALYLFDKWLEKETFVILLLAAASTALAILVKPTSIHIGLIFLLMLFIRHRLGIVKRWDLWLFAIISLLPGLLWYLHARNLYLEYGNTFGVLSGGDNKLGGLNYWLRPDFYLNLIRLDFKWLFTTLGIVPFLIGIGLAIRKRQFLLLVLGIVVILVYYMIVARYAQAEWGMQYHIFALPYAAIGVGLGFEWLFRKAVDRPSLHNLTHLSYRFIGFAIIVIMVMSSAHLYRSELLVPAAQHLADCAQSVAYLVPEDALVIVGTESLATENGIPNNYQEPQIFFYSHRHGWSLPRDWYTPDKVEQLRQDGASYLIMPQFAPVPALTSYLQANSEQIGPGVEAGCSIYRFLKTT